MCRGVTCNKIHGFTNFVVLCAYKRRINSADSESKIRKFITVSIEAHPTGRSCHKAIAGKCQAVSDCSNVLI
jgi:hypothetical protein